MTFTNKLKELLSLVTVNVSGSIIFALFWIYLATILPKTEYGELGFLISIVNVGSAISIMGFRTVIVVYESKNENVFFPSFILVLISANITALATLAFTQNVMVSILVVGLTIFNIVIAGLNSQERFKALSLHRILRAGVTVILALIAYQYFGIEGILLGYFISTLLILKELRQLIKNQKLEFSIIKPKIKFMLHAYVMRLTEVFVRWGDKLLIGVLFGFTFLASYYVAVQFLLLLSTIPQSISIYLLPQESRGKKNKNIKFFSIGISCLIAIFSIIIIPYGINEFLPKYEESILPMQVLSIALIPLTIISIQESEFFGKENSRVVLIGSIIQSVFYLLSIIFLGEILGLIGISLAFVLAVIIKVLFNLLINKK